LTLVGDTAHDNDVELNPPAKTESKHVQHEDHEVTKVMNDQKYDMKSHSATEKQLQNDFDVEKLKNFMTALGKNPILISNNIGKPDGPSQASQHPEDALNG
jgi:hypothetical protein